MPYKCEHGHTEFNPLCVACEVEIDNITSLKRLRAELGLNENAIVVNTKSGLSGDIVGVKGDKVIIELHAVGKQIEISKSNLVPVFTQTAPQANPS